MSFASKKDSDHHGWLQEIGRLVSGITGVQLGAKQSSMLQTRLSRRIHELGFTQPEQYLEYVRNHLMEEVPKLVALLTTHHTYFFREFSQFQYLEEKTLPALIPKIEARQNKTLKVWSAGCSFGQEVYSLAMFLDFHLKRLAPHLKLDILGSDVDPESVGKAKNGVYLWKDIKQIPLNYLWSHWVRGTEDISDFAKAKPSLKSFCRFETGSLLELDKNPLEKFDIIFCRNVLIYFEGDQILQVGNSLLDRLNPGGQIFIGLSESLLGSGLPLAALAPSVYESAPIEAPSSVKPPNVLEKIEIAAPVRVAAKRLKIFCVDDSSTILGMLKKILEPEFEIVGTARDGLEAAEKLKTIQCDVMTLDIHMPRQNGIEFLSRTDIPNRPPTVIISSVPREDSSQALKCLELGARDYIEKPDIYSLETRADEIRSKIRSAMLAVAPSTGIFVNERATMSGAKIENPDKKLRVIVAGAADRQKVVGLLSEFTGAQPATVVLIAGADGLLPALGESFGQVLGKSLTVLSGSAQQIESGKVYLGDFATLASSVALQGTGKRVSLLVLGPLSEALFKKIGTFSECQILLEDLEADSSRPHAILVKASRVAPCTSLAYHSNAYLGQRQP